MDVLSHILGIPKIGGGGGVAAPVPVPDGFDWNPPVAVYKTGGRTFGVGDFDVSQLAPTGKAYYVDVVGGNNSNTGLSAGQALQTLEAAFGKSDYDVIYVAPGLYDWVNGWHALSPTRNFSLIATAPGVILSRHEAKVYAADGENPGAYKTTWANVSGGNAFDAAYLDENGYYSALTLAASAAACASTPGSWYTDNASVWVHLIDDRAPDSNLRVFRAASHVILTRDNLTAYFEGINIEGGSSAAFWVRNNSSTGGTTVYAKDCQFRYAIGNGVSVQGVDTIFQNCVAEANSDDGFNYHIRNTVIPNSVEIGCIGRWNGYNDLADQSANGSSTHDAGKIVRVSCEYHNNRGPNVIDIDNAQSWNLGVYAHESITATAGNRVNFAVVGDMWLDTCESADSDVDLSTLTGGTIYTRDLISEGNNAGSGTITTY